MKELGVLIMAAGKGTRMKSALPKVLQPILDRPMLDYVIRAASAGEAAVLVSDGQVARHVEAAFPSVTLLWQPQPPLGTGHAVQSAQDWWRGYKTLIVLNGDLPLIQAKSLNTLVNDFKAGDAGCVLISFITPDPGAYGRVVRSPEGQVRVVEYKDASEAERQIQEVNAGCYLFRTAALERVIGRLSRDNAQGEYYLPDVLPLMAAEGVKVTAHPLPSEDLTGVNTQAELAEATALMRRRILEGWMAQGVRVMDPATTWVGPDVELAPDVALMPNVQIWGRSRVGRGSVIGSGSMLTNAVLGEGVTLTANVIIEDSELREGAKAGPFAYIRGGSRLEPRAFAGKFVELKKAVVGEGSKVPHLSYLGDATLGRGVNIGAGTITCNYDGKEKHPTVIGDHCFVGSDTMFVAPVTVGDNAATAAGSVITGAVPEGALGVGRARQRNIDGWSRRKKERE